MGQNHEDPVQSQSYFHVVITQALFGIKVYSKYSESASVQNNIEVLNTSRCLDAINTMVLVYFDFGKAEVPNRASMFRVTLDTRQQ
jgi:hypothetical protein